MIDQASASAPAQEKQASENTLTAAQAAATDAAAASTADLTQAPAFAPAKGYLYLPGGERVNSTEDLFSDRPLLLHTCCAPCSVACVASLRAEGIEPTAFWMNPNIHPYQEWKARRNTLREYTALIGQRLIEDGEYGLREFIAEVGGDLAFGQRCLTCYRMRMDRTARYAKESGFAAFSTTLLVSPYQNHPMLIEACERAAENCGIPFLCRDFRPMFRAGQEEAARLGLYRQKYCGCIFSEEERFDKRFRKKKS